MLSTQLPQHPRAKENNNMPPKTPKPAAGGDAAERKQPTAQEAFLFYTIIRNMKGKPEVDWAAVAVDNGFKNAETAKVSLVLSIHHMHTTILAVVSIPY